MMFRRSYRRGFNGLLDVFESYGPLDLGRLQVFLDRDAVWFYFGFVFFGYRRLYAGGLEQRFGGGRWRVRTYRSEKRVPGTGGTDG